MVECVKVTSNKMELFEQKFDGFLKGKLHALAHTFTFWCQCVFILSHLHFLGLKLVQNRVCAIFFYMGVSLIKSIHLILFRKHEKFFAIGKF